jgi:hypothetical protein
LCWVSFASLRCTRQKSSNYQPGSGSADSNDVIGALFGANFRGSASLIKLCELRWWWLFEINMGRVSLALDWHPLEDCMGER